MGAFPKHLTIFRWNDRYSNTFILGEPLGVLRQLCERGDKAVEIPYLTLIFSLGSVPET